MKVNSINVLQNLGKVKYYYNVVIIIIEERVKRFNLKYVNLQKMENFLKMLYQLLLTTNQTILQQKFTYRLHAILTWNKFWKVTPKQ